MPIIFCFATFIEWGFVSALLLKKNISQQAVIFR